MAVCLSVCHKARKTGDSLNSLWDAGVLGATKTHLFSQEGRLRGYTAKGASAGSLQAQALSQM